MSQNTRTNIEVPDPEVVPRSKRRQFAAEYKLRILKEADNCTEHGQVGGLLRREGLYSSHLTTWQRQRAKGQFEGLSPKKRGRQSPEQDTLQTRGRVSFIVRWQIANPGLGDKEVSTSG